MYSLNRLRISIILPVIVGAAIYLTARDSRIAANLMIEYLIGKENYDQLRSEYFVQFWSVMPEWTYLSLPNALWTFSFAISFLLIWQNGRVFFWASLSWCVSILFEVLQIFGIVPGTFDPYDLLLVIIAVFFSWMYITSWLKQYLLKPPIKR